jgi:hypothetical protein
MRIPAVPVSEQIPVLPAVVAARLTLSGQFVKEVEFKEIE